MNLIITPSQWALNCFLIRINWVHFRVHFNYSIKCQNLLHLAKYTVWLNSSYKKKKLHKPIRMQTASIKTLKTNFRSMTTSKEIQTTFQANWAPSTPTLRTLDHPGEVQVTVIWPYSTVLPVKVKVEKCQQTTANCTTDVYFVRLQTYRTLKQGYCIR